MNRTGYINTTLTILIGHFAIIIAITIYLLCLCYEWFRCHHSPAEFLDSVALGCLLFVHIYSVLDFPVIVFCFCKVTKKIGMKKDFPSKIWRITRKRQYNCRRLGASFNNWTIPLGFAAWLVQELFLGKYTCLNCGHLVMVIWSFSISETRLFCSLNI